MPDSIRWKLRAAAFAATMLSAAPAEARPWIYAGPPVVVPPPVVVAPPPPPVVIAPPPLTIIRPPPPVPPYEMVPLPRRGYVWEPGRWFWTPRGYIWRRGWWRRW
ncbi:hypothetical protein [Komagataeibacter rhaeticus]|uniref:hypothetical protein n=2 Tax=Acetobacteraceae TaxID=433 RepID=UPI0038CF4B33